MRIVLENWNLTHAQNLLIMEALAHFESLDEAAASLGITTKRLRREMGRIPVGDRPAALADKFTQSVAKRRAG